MSVALFSSIAPRIIIPGFFMGGKISTMTDPGEIFQTIAFSAFFVTAVITLFQGKIPWLSIISSIASVSYWYMMKDSANRDFYRYSDWVLTTPLMLVGILTATKAPIEILIGSVVCDLLMIGSGYKGVQEKDANAKFAWFMAGMVFFLPILWILLQQKTYKTAVYLTLALWSLYPIVYYAEEVKAIDTTTTIVSYSIMDMIAKIGLVNLLHV